MEFGAQVINNGPAVPEATVVITLPSTLRLSSDLPPTRFEQWWTDNADDNGTPLRCVPSLDGLTVSCGTGPLAAGANIVVGIGFTTSSTATPASAPATFTVALNPTASTTPTPNRVQATVYFVGTAKLTLTVNPDHARVTVGKAVTLTGTVHNAGPNPAPNSYLFGADFADDGGSAHFQIANSAPLPGAPGGGADGSARTLAIAADASDVKQPSFGYWPLDTIAPGKTASTAIIVKASTVGTDELGISAGSDAIDQDCDVADSGSASGSSSAPAVPARKSVVKLVPRRVRGHRVTAQQAGVCEDFVIVELTAVAAAPLTTTPPPSTVTPASTSSQPATSEPTTSSPTATAAVVPSSTTVAPAGSPAQAAANATELANTGARQTRPTVIASLLAILAGAALCLAGRRRPDRVRGSHR